MKAITVRQPWASLIAIGAKKIETRGWSLGYRGPIAIHAGKNFTPAARGFFYSQPFNKVLKDAGFVTAHDLPLGAIVAVATLTDVISTTDVRMDRLLCPSDGTYSPESEFGDFSDGRFAWVLDDVQRVRPEILCNGRQGLWHAPPIPADRRHPLDERRPA